MSFQQIIKAENYHPENMKLKLKNNFLIVVKFTDKEEGNKLIFS